MPRGASADWQSSFEESTQLTCVLDAAFRVVYCNPAWDAAARERGAESATGAKMCGRPLLSVVPRILEYHYLRLLQRSREKCEIVCVDYECNSDVAYRSYRMTITPILETYLLANVHSVLSEGEIPYPVCRSTDHDYGAGEFTMMCAHCRRTKRLRDPVWDWVPEFIRAMPPRVSHGLCSECIVRYGKE